MRLKVTKSGLKDAQDLLLILDKTNSGENSGEINFISNPDALFRKQHHPISTQTAVTQHFLSQEQ